MPFIEETDIGQQVQIPEPVEAAQELEAEAPSVGETFMAGFRQENSFVSAAAKGFGITPSWQPEEGYDPYENDLAGYEMFAESFIDSKSGPETANIKFMIDQELQDRKTLSEAGGMGIVAQMAAAITDPIYLPLMMAGVGEVKLGTSVASAFGRTAMVSGVAEIPVEAAKHMSQETRTGVESAFIIGGAALLSGMMGAGIAKLSKKEFETLSKKAGDVINNPESQKLSMGAAHVVQNSMEDLELVNVAKMEQWGVSPLVRTQVSPVKGTREVASAMMETPLISKGNIEGKATAPEGGAVETRVKMWDAPMVEALTDLDKVYVKYRQGKGSTARIINDYVLRNRQDKLSPRDFRIEVGKAMRRGDKSTIPEVAEAAASFRSKVFDPLKDAAINEKLLPPGIETSTAVSYLTRMYNHNKIISKRGEWDGVVESWLGRIRTKAISRLDDSIAKGKEPSASLKGEAGLSDAELREVSNAITDNILGNASGRLPYDVVQLARGPLKERTFNIPDSLIEDFLESDIDLIARQYTRTMGPDVELTRMFGDIDLKGNLEEIGDQYTKLIKEATTEKQRNKLQNKRDADIRDLEAMRDRIRGTYRTPEDPNAFFVRAGRVLRDVNFMRMLGGMTLSAIPDLARPIAVNGLKPVARSIQAMVTAPKRFKMARLEAKKAAVGLDMVLNSRMASLAEIGDIYARGTRFERSLRGVSDAFGKITLMSQWNTALKQFSGVVTQDRILEESVKWASGKINKNNIRRMASAGIGEDMAKRIAKQFEKHGDDGTIKLSNGHKWDDTGALETFRAAVLKDVDRTIITPGLGEKPLWTSSETGKMIFQFKTFASAAHHKILLADLQNRDLQALNGFLLSVALGSATYGLKMYVSDREVSTDPSKLIVESLDRSGAFGYLWDINNMMEKGTRGNFGVNSMLGAPPMSRYASRNVVGSLLGPSLGTAEDLIQITGGAASGEFSKKELAKLRKMLPAQNLFYIRRLLNELEKEAGKGLPK